MDDLLKLIPSSAVMFIGLSVLWIISKLFSRVFEKGGEWIWFKFAGGEKNKRKYPESFEYNGVERRAELKHLEEVAGQLLSTMNNFIQTVTISNEDLNRKVDEIKRAQTRNWEELFLEYFPILHKAIKSVKN